MKTILTTLNAKYIHTALSLRLLKAYNESDYDIEMKEFTIKDPDIQVVSDIYQLEPDIIGFSCYIWNIEPTLRIVKMLKQVAPNVTIVLGGPEVSYDVQEWMEQHEEIDFIISGEGEVAFKQLLDELSGQKRYEKVSGLTYRQGKEVMINDNRENIDVNQIPTPYRYPEDVQDLGKRIVYFETSRGCPFQCQFCLSSLEQGVRYFDIERTKEDLLYLIKNGAKMIKFIDRTFNLHRSYALEVFQFLIDNHQGCQFQFEITADIMRPEVIEFLNEHAPPGIFRFEIGVQSTNDMTNELVKRKQNFKKLARTVSLIKNGGKIDQHLDLIAGLPEENYDSFRKTFNDVFELRPEELQLGFLKMLRGTGMRKMAQEYDYKYTSHSPYEILSHKTLPFDDVIAIKQVEDILEKYWNDHRMDRTLEYLFQHVYASPFDFFQQFGTYWEQQNWQRIGHQLEDLFLRIWQFLSYKNIDDLDVAFSFLTADYLLQQKQKPRKRWWSSLSIEPNRFHLDDANKELLQQIPASFLKQTNGHIDKKWMKKHIIIEKISIDIDEFLQSGDIHKGDFLLLVAYDPKTGSNQHIILNNQESSFEVDTMREKT
ncbi:B12-binding domain-containing radical SAM protein [Texcoconibacillus texcoconensis]|uniref:Anaerobic magnesium-protoporphyrin IX monomethyl ester cyclase n=1 Tax=Texcoconibacillus texcoconensis TaxID=1095777 RepID=A0A840QST4_9BACI|nr:B12-binding domain-containing radical SAM protein [Texcoconibacillus texcoconensis]MBB5174351.1 anaerobic magnesium-protoporphyrin IX monomethyl ester cyclase [Texcoconibacillus texcoconensis]